MSRITHQADLMIFPGVYQNIGDLVCLNFALLVRGYMESHIQVREGVFNKSLKRFLCKIVEA